MCEIPGILFYGTEGYTENIGGIQAFQMCSKGRGKNETKVFVQKVFELSNVMARLLPVTLMTVKTRMMMTMTTTMYKNILILLMKLTRKSNFWESYRTTNIGLYSSKNCQSARLEPSFNFLYKYGYLGYFIGDQHRNFPSYLKCMILIVLKLT